jgi:SLOG cluster3 family
MASALGLAERQYCRRAQHKHHGRESMAKRPKSKRRPVNGIVAQRVFLSASVPLPSRNATYFNTADVVAIRDAVRALTIVVIEQKAQLVFGGHPAISPMIRLQIAQAGMPVGDRVIMFQSRFFDRVFPDDNAAFERVILTDAVDGDRQKSLVHMRETMLSGSFNCGVFIGRMEGVEEEYEMFRRIQPDVPAFPIASTGAASAILYNSNPTIKREHPELQDEFSYISLMRSLVRPKLSGDSTSRGK